MQEKTLIIIKPDAIEKELVDSIFSELDNLGQRSLTIKIPVDMNKILSHYEDSIKKHGETLRKKLFYFENKEIILALLEGEDIIKKAKDKIGATDPKKSPLGTIRQKYGDDSLDVAMREGRLVRNLVHASGSKDEFEKEFNVWKQYFS